MRTKLAISGRTRARPLGRAAGPAACTAAAVLLSACSADVTRFDFPAFNLGKPGTDTASLPAAPEPIYQFDGPGKEPAKLPPYQAASNQAPYQVAQVDYSSAGGSARTNEVTRSNLGKPDSDLSIVDAPYAPAAPRSAGRALPRELSRPAPARVARPGFTGRGETITVAKGDTLYGISRRYGVSVGAIQSANNMRGTAIRLGQKLIIPGAGTSGGFANASPAPAPSYDQQVTSRRTDRVRVRRAAPRPATRPIAGTVSAPIVDGQSYRVKAGDSLYAIARATGHTANDIAALNGITDPGRLAVGQVLRLPAGGAAPRVRTVASPKPVSEPRRRVVSLDPAAGVGGRETAPYAASRANNATPTSFRWPVRGRVISKFGGKTASGNNDGINLAVPEGTSIKAVEDGVVAYAGSELKGYGKLLLVRHADDWVSAYAHNSELSVKRGDKVRRGQTIAKAGRTGAVERPQLHFELRKGSKPVDPLKYLARR
ncbi:MAG: LysM peptidoglycan-binding domain-containing protein [Pseudomonadota bacterium]